METIYSRSDHYPTHPEISNKDYHFFKNSGNPIFCQIFGHQRAKTEARNTKIYRGQETHPIRINARYEMNWANSFFSKSSGNPIFSQIFGHQRAKNEARNKKMNRVQETHPIRLNARYEMNWADTSFNKFRKPHFLPNIWPPEAKNEARNTKMNRVQETHPIRVNASYEMNWANSFFKKFQKRTDGQTSGWIQYTPIPPSME